MRRRSLVALSLVLAAVVASSPVVRCQDPQEKVDLAAIDRIKEEALKHSQVMEILSVLTDVHGPRLTGSPNIKVAGEWARRKLSGWGLQNARLEPWGPFGKGWSLEGFSANVIMPQFIPLIAYPKAWSPGTHGTVRGEAIYLDAKTEADLEKYRGKLKGAMVFISPPRKVEAHFQAEAQRQSDERLLALANAEPPSGAPPARRARLTSEERAAEALQQKKWDLCFSERPEVVLEPGRGDGGTVFVQGVTLPQPPSGTPADRRIRAWNKDAPEVMPQVVVAVEHYNRLVRMLTQGIPVKLEINIDSRFHDDDPMGFNVIAEIPGSDLGDELVMLGGHFDSWHSGTGTTDNAAGSSVALEAVRILQKLDVKPRRTVRIALWGGEEQGLLGSKAYVGEHFGRRIDPPSPTQNRPEDTESASSGDSLAVAATERQAAPPRFELKPGHAKFAGYFNLDNGTGKIRGVYLQGNEGVRSIFRAWLAPFKEMGASTLSISNTGGTDHLSFDAVGLPGFQFIQDPVEYNSRTHHSSMDVYDRVQEEDLKQAAAIMASFVYLAATRDEKLPRKPLPGPSSIPAMP